MRERKWINALLIGLVPLGATLALTFSVERGSFGGFPDWGVAALWIATGWAWVYVFLTRDFVKRWVHAHRWRTLLTFVIIGLVVGGCSGWLLWWSVRREPLPVPKSKAASVQFVRLNVDRPIVGQPLVVKIYLRNTEKRTLQITGVTTVTIRSVEKGDNLDLIAEELWSKLAALRSDITMSMPPNLEVWPTVTAPVITPEIWRRLQDKTAAIFVMGIFQYTDEGSKMARTEVCAWLQDGTHYTLCARHNNLVSSM